MSSINIGICDHTLANETLKELDIHGRTGHDDDLVIAELLRIELDPSNSKS